MSFGAEIALSVCVCLHVVQLMPTSKLTSCGVLPHCSCPRCLIPGLSQPTAVCRPETSTDRVPGPPAQPAAEVQANPPQTQRPLGTDECSLHLQEDGSSDSVSLCCLKDKDHERANMYHPCSVPKCLSAFSTNSI